MKTYTIHFTLCGEKATHVTFVPADVEAQGRKAIQHYLRKSVEEKVVRDSLVLNGYELLEESQ